MRPYSSYCLHKRAEIRAAGHERRQALGDQILSGFGVLQWRREPAGGFRDHILRRFRRSKHPGPEDRLVTRVAGLGNGRYVWKLLVQV